MHGTTAERLPSGQRTLAAEEPLARSAEKTWPLGTSILLMAGISVLLWSAIYLIARAFL